MDTKSAYIRWFEDVTIDDVDSVGGKNASLGELVRSLGTEGVRVPGGFAITAHAYREFLSENDLTDTIKAQLDAMANGRMPLEKCGLAIRRAIRKGTFPEPVARAIQGAYRELSGRSDAGNGAVAVRSSATAEDLPEASFAGQQDTFLNVSGKDEVLEACRQCYASLFTNRAIVYRRERGFDHLEVALSVGVQKMVRADKAGSGVMFSIDTETGFPGIVLINASWGLGENIVQGLVNPDEYRVFKPRLGESGISPIIGKVLGGKEKKTICDEGNNGSTKSIETTQIERLRFVLQDEEILTLARWACAIERHYGKPMDMEWAKDGEDGKLYVVQARPETAHSPKVSAPLKTYDLTERSDVLVRGLAIGQGIATGKVIVLHGPDEMDRFEDGGILVTGMTDPDWVPIMQRAAAIVTDHGGRTSHAAIVSRELGLPAVTGCGNATEVLDTGQEVTVSCADGEEGCVYKGVLAFREEEVNLDKLAEPPVRLMINVADPKGSHRWWRLPVMGIGLARMEFIINNAIKVHPLALTRFDEIEDEEARRAIETLTRGYTDKRDYFVETLARGIATIAASQYPEPAIVRMSDFKTNEYAQLLGGKAFEPKEENPMLGFRGASRYYSERYRDGFVLECRAVKIARETMGLDNIVIMLPFVRSTDEADKVLEVLAAEGLARGKNGLKIYMMCEVPSNVFLASEFAERFDGFSIGSNDLTQLTLGVDRDSGVLKPLFDERNDAVKAAIREVIRKAHAKGCKVGICGQAPSDFPDFARFLVREGIDSISLNPDSIIPVIRTLTEEVF